MSEPESPDLRIGDTEREDALKALGEHMSSGRLDIDEYGDRSARVTTARTRTELLAVFTDLPAPKPVFGAAAPPAPSVPAPVTDAPVAVARRTGWGGIVPGEITGPVIGAAWMSAIFLSGPLNAPFLWPVAIVLSIVMGPLTRNGRWNGHHQRHEDRRDRHRQIRDEMRDRRRELRRGDR